ncbi:MAG: STAS domain-containing protein [Acidimicrobiia bacterium]
MSEAPIGLNIVAEGDQERSFQLIGDVDLHTVGQLDDLLRELGTGADATLDLGGVTFMDSFGLRTVLANHELLNSHGHTLWLFHLSPAVRRLLEITHVIDELAVRH